ncbi:hypothetical protein BDZ90DRAFT_231426 [Jaminaea rosea]|uniref:EF-hand domain-containing protein n=1 Tax=Jaminaea rosea TaxID=1569628 RepID=A0A316UZ73_9BASI|nr:hypothetical protein BDZ90DRAFT_231426 [Jaminaea rosea]PWN28445.1 hypothetical protein BDZ90DRAFT_231426 [Jaminaea rosea]
MASSSSDPSTVPLSMLRGQQQQQQHQHRRANNETSPPAHYPRLHDPSNPHYHEGMEPGNQGHTSVAEDDQQRHHGHVKIGSAHVPRGAYQKAHDRDDYDDDDGADLAAPHPPFSSMPSEAGKNGRHSRASSIAASSADETDDFDWDTSDDEEEEAQVNAKLRAKRGRKVYLFCMRLARPVRVLLMGAFVTALFLVPLFVSLFAIDRSNPARPHVESWSIWLSIIAASSAGTFIVLDFLPPVILRLAIAVYGRAPEVFKTYLEVAMGCLVYVKLVLCVAWAWIALGGVNAAVWSGGVGPRPTYWKWVERAVKAIFATAIILAVEKFALHGIGVNFHKEAIKDRLEENQKALRYLDKLHASKYMRETSGSNTKRQSGNWARMGFGAGSKPPSPGANAGLGSRGYFPEAMDQNQPASGHQHHHSLFHHHNHPETASSEQLRKAKVDRKANFAAQLQDALATATMKDSKLYKKSSGSQASARRLAKKLFQNLGRHRKTLVAEDFIPYFKSETEAREAFALFDKDKNGDIDKSEMRDAVQRIYRDRRALTTSLKDINSALQKLDGVLLFISLIIVVFIWLLIFSPTSTVSNLVPLSTIVLGFSFVFGNSAKQIFESMIFIFATHPYDVGDLVCIDDNWMFVKEFGLISTVFTTVVNQTVVAPNALLASQKYIHNSRRSGTQWEVTFIQLPFDTALAKIDDFRRLLRAWIKENDREWGGGLEVNYDSITNQTAVQLVIAMEHKGNWQDWGTRWSRRTKLMRQVKVISEELGIDATPMPRQPVSYINPRAAGVGPRSSGPRVGDTGPAGAAGAQPGVGGQAGSAGGFGGGMAIGGVGTGFGPNITDKGKST